MKRKAIQFLVMLLVLVIPAISFGQPPAAGNGGGTPDAVPFDDNMNLLFLVAGIAFAVLVTIKQLRSKAATSK
jgi:hypothetical protein